MALPGDVTTTTVTFGPYTDAAGAVALVGVIGKLFPVDPSTNKRVRVTDIASGQVVVPEDVKVTIASDGTASAGPIPHTGQATLSPAGFAWRMEWDISSSSRSVSPGNLTFVVPSGPTTDFDLLIPAATVPAVAISQPTVASVAGLTGAPTAQQVADALDVPLRAAFESRLTVNVRDYGATGDGTTDDTAAIQAAINAVQTAGGGTVTFPIGTYRITAALNITRAGVRLFGASRFGAVIRQATAAAHGVTITHDGVDGFTYMRGCTIERLRLEGTGGPTAGTPSSGVGIRAVGSGTTSPTYAGQHLALRDVTLSGWDTCVRVHRWDNCVSLALGLEYSRIGYWSDGNANTHKLFGVAGTNCTETALRFGDGMGVEVSAEDIISCGRMLDLLEFSQVTLHAYNFESCTGTTFVNVGIGAYLVAGGGRILKNIGVDVPGFSVDFGGQLVQFGAPTFSGFTTATVIKKLDGNATVYVLGPTSNLSATPEALISEASATYPAGLWPTRIDNSIPGASANLRNLLLGKMVRDTVADVDELFYYVRDRSTGANAYSQRSLSSVIRGSGSPAGVVAAGPGTLYLNKDGGAGQTLWVKETGTGNTGWAAK